MDLNLLFRGLVTLLCIGAILALPQGYTAAGELSGSGISALESWILLGEQAPSLTQHQGDMENWDVSSRME